MLFQLYSCSSLFMLAHVVLQLCMYLCAYGCCLVCLIKVCFMRIYFRTLQFPGSARLPRGPQKAADGSRGPQRIPGASRMPQMAREAPRGSQRTPEGPRRPKAPETHRGSQRAQTCQGGPELEGPRRPRASETHRGSHRAQEGQEARLA